MSPVGVVLVAAGSGSRLGAGVPKAFVTLGGQELLTRALGSAAACLGVSVVVVVAPATHLAEAKRCVSGAGIAPGVEVVVVAGGPDRTASVAAGLAALPAEASIVLVHDAARALTPTSMFTAVVDAVESGHPAVVPGLPVVDTIKQVDASGLVITSPDRTMLRAVQTPQGFTREVLTNAHLNAVTLEAGGPASDDAALVERMGVAVQVITGHPRAHKITTAEDLILAERLLGDLG